MRISRVILSPSLSVPLSRRLLDHHSICVYFKNHGCCRLVYISTHRPTINNQFFLIKDSEKVHNELLEYH